MSLLGAAFYDPTTAASKATSSLLAMTAIDTTNLRVTFTTPTGGTSVLVRIRGNITGASTLPQLLLGVLDGSTVMGRMAPIVGRGGSASAAQQSCESVFLVTGLTQSTSYTWVAAYGVEFAVASTNIKYGGPDSSSTAAFGGFGFEVYSTETLLAGKMYDPATAASVSLSATTVMTALDTTNLRLTFTAPSSGNVLVRLRGVLSGTTTATGGTLLLGLLDGSAIRGRARAFAIWSNTAAPIATDMLVEQTRIVITGLTPSSSYTWDAACTVVAAAGTGSLAWGGPNNTTQADATGGFAYDIWDVGGTAGGSSYALAIGQVF